MRIHVAPGVGTGTATMAAPDSTNQIGVQRTSFKKSMPDGFRTITRKDLGWLSRHYLQFEPYSDFNVVNLWGYMVPHARFIANEGAVVYELLDYITDEPYFSVFGDASSRPLVQELAQSIYEPTFTLVGVPESTYQTAFAHWPAVKSVEEDINNHDYVFSVKRLANLGKYHRSKRKTITKLARNHPGLEIKIIDHSLPEVRQQMYSVFKRWIKDSHSKAWQREYRALQRMLRLKGFNIICVGAFDQDRLVGFTVNEIEDNNYYQGHYGKAGYKYRGLGLLLECETAKILHKQYGSEFMNLQQDVGIAGLRSYKQSLHPLKQLKKYILVIDTQLARR